MNTSRSTNLEWELALAYSQIAAMRPVFEAALQWGEWWRPGWDEDTADAALGDAIDAYRQIVPFQETQ
jgi:hypothetical protein